MKKVFVLGGTGYIANRLVPSLLCKGYKVKVGYRNRKNVQSSWVRHPNVKLVFADTFDKKSLLDGFKNCKVIYYLVHSMETTRYKQLTDNELKSANNTLEAALANNVERIVFLGGLKSSNEKISKHLSSRIEVARLFRGSPITTTVFRASVIIGSGSAICEIMRKLLTYFPVLLVPRSINNKIQPIAVENVIYYLVNCLDTPETMNRSFDIGGEEIFQCKEILTMMKRYIGVRTILLTAPILPIRLISYGLSLATVVPTPISRSLVGGIESETVCQNYDIRTLLPQKLLSIEDQIHKILSEWKYLLTCDIIGKPTQCPCWSLQGDYPWVGFKILKDHRYIVLKGNSSKIWSILSSIGGKRGYFGANWLWQFRGILNMLVGGKGLYKAPKKYQKGEKFDFWTIYRVKKNEELVLWTEFKVPGQATLTFRLQQLSGDKIILHQILKYYPKGTIGLFHWSLTYGFRQYAISKMFNKIVKLSGSEIIHKTIKNPTLTKDGKLVIIN